MPIIFNVAAYEEYPFENINKECLELIRSTADKLPAYFLRDVSSLLKYLECYLQITEQKLDLRTVNSLNFNNLAVNFMGALNSDRFISISKTRRNFLLNIWKNILLELSKTKPRIQVKDINFYAAIENPALLKSTEYFNSIDLKKENLWLWEGWSSKNKNGKRTFMPLYLIYKKLGKEFTTRLFNALDTYFSSRKSDDIPCLKSLSVFISSYKKPISAVDFHNANFITQFWQEFLIFHVKRSYAEGTGQRISTIITDWRGPFKILVNEYLIPNNICARHWGNFPAPPPRYVKGNRTKIITADDGREVKTKLLTNVPLQINDDEAIGILFCQIENDLNIIIEWAEKSCHSIWHRYQRRKILAAKGTVRVIQDSGGNNGGHKWLTKRSNPEHLANACATFEKYGYQISRHISLLFPIPLNKTADEIGLPITDALLPHCCLLVANHPSITPSFLENFQLFDKNGNLTGYLQLDDTHMLIGEKSRKGAKLAQQKIVLNQKTIEIVKQIIDITSPLRNFLKEKSDDSWRYLLLTCKNGFAYPTRISRLAISTSDPKRKQEIAKEIGNYTKKEQSEITELVDRFSLPSLRASAGTLIYLKTKSVEKMASALGHVKYDPKLLDRYLPRPLREFFQERWIRIFQTGIIVESLKESPLLLKSSGLKTVESLHEFLYNHALKIPNNKDIKKHSLEKSGSKEVIFGVNSTILSALITLKKTVECNPTTSNAKAIYWAKISDHLIPHIQKNLNCRPDIQKSLENAFNTTSPIDLS